MTNELLRQCCEFSSGELSGASTLMGVFAGSPTFSYLFLRVGRPITDLRHRNKERAHHQPRRNKTLLAGIISISNHEAAATTCCQLGAQLHCPFSSAFGDTNTHPVDGSSRPSGSEN